MPPVFILQPGLELVLASGSPRRRTLLASLGLEFSVQVPQVEEPDPCPGMEPDNYARNLARIKGNAVLSDLASSNALIISADTIVVIDGKILGKPTDREDALRMLGMLNGRTHKVITAFYMSAKSGTFAQIAEDAALVRFGQWPVAVLRAYVESGEPMDKAGAYAIQGYGSFLVENIEGSWTTIAGLPVAPLTALMLEAGLIAPAPVPDAAT